MTKKEEILKSIVPADCWWEDMRNFTNCPEKYIHTAMDIYKYQSDEAVLSELVHEILNMSKSEAQSEIVEEIDKYYIINKRPKTP